MTTPTLSGGQFVRAKSASAYSQIPTKRAQAVLPEADFSVVAQHMFALMLRNISSDGFVFADPTDPSVFSRPGCIIAAPSYPANAPGVDQDYVFNWVRDAALTAMELVAADLPNRPGAGVGALNDYVAFAKTCQDNAAPTLAHACFTIQGQPRPWTEQSDGPALQTLAMLQAFGKLGADAQATARQVMDRNLQFLMEVYQAPTTNLWEEHSGYSFFARAAMVRCLRAVITNTAGVAVPPGASDAVAWLETALQGHWDGTRYLSMLTGSTEGGAATDPGGPGYDPNIDIVMACIYGGVPVTDTRMLATAAQLRGQWADESSPSVYPINLADRELGLGPLLGRYPGDTYDGDMADHVLGGHPWALSTCNFAELYYRLAGEVAETGTIPYDELSAPFFSQVDVAADTAPLTAAAALENAGDAMLAAVVYHSDNLELSEQFDGWTGYQKSVRDLTWSYAAFLSAVRAKTSRAVQG
jgi:glucoamylase